MIIYFSATGNTLHVVKKIAKENERLVFIPEAIDNNEYEYSLEDNESLGIISPTYNWTIPSVVKEFLEKVKISYKTKPYTYYVGTFGTTTGAAAAMANKIMKEKGLEFNARFDIRMPDTWTVTFDLSNKDKVKRINDKAEIQIEELRKQISDKLTGKHMDLTMPYFTGYIGGQIYDNSTRLTKNLKVNNDCIGCGLCAKKCPVHAIEMENKHPVWVKDKCAMCLGCLHRCPKFAISYNEKTNTHGQYTYKEKITAK